MNLERQRISMSEEDEERERPDIGAQVAFKGDFDEETDERDED